MKKPLALQMHLRIQEALLKIFLKRQKNFGKDKLKGRSSDEK
jgi:hypothetical protein